MIERRFPSEVHPTTLGRDGIEDKLNKISALSVSSMVNA
jgi:hypothetical protein